MGIAPPSYECVVQGQARGSDVKGTVSYESEDDDVSDGDSLLELEGEAHVKLGQDWKEGRGVDGELHGESSQLTKCQQRRAERMQRKAEKAARKAGRTAVGL